MSKALHVNQTQSASYGDFNAVLNPSYRSQHSNSEQKPKQTGLSFTPLNSQFPISQEFALTSNVDRKTEMSQPIGYHTFRDKNANKLNNFSEYQMYPPSRQEDKFHQGSKDRIHSYAKTSNVQIRLEDIDADDDEFAETPSSGAYRQRIMSYTPISTTTSRTLGEVLGMYTGSTLTPSRGSLRGSLLDSPPKDLWSNFNNDKPLEKMGTNPFTRNSVTTNPPLLRSQLIQMYSTKNKRKEVLLDVKVLKVLAKFLTCAEIMIFKKLTHEFRNQKSYKKLFKDQMMQHMLKGLTERDQNEYWNTLLDYRRIQEIQPFSFTFTSQLLKDCPHVKDIQKDLDRTLPEYEKYSTIKGKDALLKVLIAISNTVKDVGYIQGLNSIAGVFLFYLKEEKSFWMVLYMMNKMKIKDILTEDFDKVHTLNYQLQTFLENYVPDVANYLSKASFELSYFTTPWFITLFSYFLSLSDIIKTWNLFFVKGNAFLIQLGLAVFSSYREKILNTEYDDLGSFFKYDLREVTEKNEHLFEEAMKFHVPNRLLVELEDHYKSGKPHLMLIKGPNSKLSWQVLMEVPTSGKNASSKEIGSLDFLADEPKFPPPAARRSVMSVQNLVNTLKVGVPEAIKNIFTKSPERSPNKSPKKSPDQDSSKYVHTEPTYSVDTSPYFDFESTSKPKTRPANKTADGESPSMREKRLRENMGYENKLGAFSRTVNFTNATADTERTDLSPNITQNLRPFQIGSQNDLRLNLTESYRRESEVPSLVKLQLFSGKATPEQSPRGPTFQRLGEGTGFSFRPQTKLNSECVSPNHSNVQRTTTLQSFEYSTTPIAQLKRDSGYGYQKPNFYGNE